jgi:hypothetical protein
MHRLPPAAVLSAGGSRPDTDMSFGSRVRVQCESPLRTCKSQKEQKEDDQAMMKVRKGYPGPSEDVRFDRQGRSATDRRRRTLFTDACCCPQQRGSHRLGGVPPTSCCALYKGKK